MRAIITVIGSDQTGIIAGVSGVLSEKNANIVDISQTVLRDNIFTMIMLVELDGISVPYQELKEALEQVGEKIGVEVRMQREEIFRSMHRL